MDLLKKWNAAIEQKFGPSPRVKEVFLSDFHEDLFERVWRLDFEPIEKKVEDLNFNEFQMLVDLNIANLNLKPDTIVVAPGRKGYDVYMNELISFMQDLLFNEISYILTDTDILTIKATPTRYIPKAFINKLAFKKMADKNADLEQLLFMVMNQNKAGRIIKESSEINIEEHQEETNTLAG